MSRNPWFALFAFILLSFPSLIIAQQNLPDPNSGTGASAGKKAADAGDPSLRLALELESDLDRDLLPPPDLTETPNPVKPCDFLAEHAKLSQAWYEFKGLQLEAATRRFSTLTSSCDPRVQFIAVRFVRRGDRESSAWWWQMGRYFPPLRWFDIRYPRVLWIGRVVIVFLVLIALLVILVLLGSKTIGAIFGLSSPRATIMTPTALTAGDQAKAQCDYFAARLQDGSIEVTHRVARQGNGLQVSATSFLAVSSQTAGNLRDSLPKIKGVELSAFGKFFFYLYRYFCGWRVESQMAFRPSTLAKDGTVLAHARIVAFATVRFAWIVKGDPLMIDLPVDDEYDIDDAAFALAIGVMGNYPPRKTKTKNGKNITVATNFSKPESYLLFIQGLGALLHYEKEAAREHPRRCTLEHSMNVCLNRLRKCVAKFRDDPLPRFAFGIALSMRNQEVYVDRLQQVQVKSACFALGRSFAFCDMLGTGKPPAGSDLMQCLSDEANIAQPFHDLDTVPWPLLDEACRIFERLEHLDSGDSDDDVRDLKDRATYNLALAYSRLGGEYCSKGCQTLDPEQLKKYHVLVPQDSTDSKAPSHEEERRKSEAKEDEYAALVLQFEILRKSLAVRQMKWELWHPNNSVHGAAHANETPHDLDCSVPVKKTGEFDDAFADFINFRDQIKGDSQKRIVAFKADLLADHLTQQGYIYMECATDRFPIHLRFGRDRVRPGGLELNSEEKLKKAAASFSAALEIKPNWNPAQIYLALVRRIQSGFADAYIELLEHQIKQATPDKKEDPLEIKIEMDQAQSPASQPVGPEPKGFIKDLIETVVETGIQALTQNLVGARAHSGQPSDSQNKNSSQKNEDAQKSSDLVSWKRRRDERKEQKLQFSQEADNLFAALQGDPWSDPALTAPKAKEAKSKGDTKSKAQITLSSTKVSDDANQDS